MSEQGVSEQVQGWFCPVIKYWQFGCSEVHKIEQVKCSFQRQGYSPTSTPVFLLAAMCAVVVVTK